LGFIAGRKLFFTMENSKFRPIIFVLILAVIAGFFWVKDYEQNRKTDIDGKISLLRRQIAALQKSFEDYTGQPVPEILPSAEVEQRQIIREKSQDELLTEAVAGNAPAVVSVVISKDVPLLEIVYENPFGDDPFFRDFGFTVPRYRQKGVEKQKVGAGTGFLLTSNGYILTNRHVVEDMEAEYTVLLSDGSQKTAQVIYKDPQFDVAVIKIEGNGYKNVSLGNSEDLKLGQTVIAIGNALGEYNNSVSTGIVSGLDRSIEATNSRGTLEVLRGVIQTDAAINPGNSGGPLLTLDGEVVGVNVATVVGSSNISFAIPISMVKKIIDTVVQ